MKKNTFFPMYNRFQYYDIIYDSSVSNYRIGLGYYNLPDFPESAHDIYYIIENHLQYRPDLISLKFYNTTQLWWVITRANNLTHPLKELSAGKTIRIPDPQKVLREV